MRDVFGRLILWTAKRDYIPLLIIFLILTVCALPLRSSLWLDETVSFWVIKDDWNSLFFRARQFQGQSPLYFLLLRCSLLVLGSGELALRALSLIFFFGSAALLFSLSAGMFDRKTGVLSVILFSSIHEVKVSALSARPYSAAVFFGILSFWFLLKWIDSGRKSAGAGFVLATALAFHAHYLFGVIIPVHVVMFFASRKRSEKVSFCAFAGALLLVAALFVPGFVQLQMLFERRNELSFAADPSPGALGKILFPPHLLVLMASALVFIRIFGPVRFNMEGYSFMLPVAVVIYAGIPLLFFLVSLAAGTSIFLPRYLLSYAPGIAMAYAVVLASFRESRKIPLLVPVLCLLLLLRDSDQKWRMEEWRGALRKVEEFVPAGESPPLLVYSGLVESAEMEHFQGDEEVRQYLLAPLSYYRTALKAEPLPMPGRQEVESYYKKLLEGRESVILLSLRQELHRKGRVANTPEAIDAIIGRNGFVVKESEDFGRLVVRRWVAKSG